MIKCSPASLEPLVTGTDIGVESTIECTVVCPAKCAIIGMVQGQPSISAELQRGAEGPPTYDSFRKPGTNFVPSHPQAYCTAHHSSHTFFGYKFCSSYMAQSPFSGFVQGGSNQLSAGTLDTAVTGETGPSYGDMYHLTYLLPLGVYLGDGGISYSEESDEEAELAVDSDKSDEYFD